MTENEAIAYLGYFKSWNNDDRWLYDETMEEFVKCCVEALEEIQQYREIGTVEECREAVEKQKAKEIIIRNWNPTKCPTCGHELSESLGDGYYKHPTFLERCPECGQAIRWEESEEK